jgi:hypothetical protein
MVLHSLQLVLLLLVLRQQLVLLLAVVLLCQLRARQCSSIPCRQQEVVARRCAGPRGLVLHNHPAWC